MLRTPFNEIISKNKAGVKIRPGNSKDLLKSIVNLIKGKKLKNKMGKEGRVLVEKEFNIKNIAQRTQKSV